MKVIVFDIGGTLMEYLNMPHVWIDYYQTAFERVRKTLLPNLTEEEIRKLIADDKNNILTFTFTSLAGEETVYRFYPYSGSGRRALMTVNGEGEFYVLTDLIEKIASDANKVLSGLDINSYGKN